MSDAINTTAIDTLLESKTSTIARDLKLNLKRILEEGSLSPTEAYLTLLATATSVEHLHLVAHAREQLASLQVPAEQIQEAAESAAIMGMLNVYYRFRHMVAKPEDYKTAGLRMTALARPQMGKEHFEMLALAVSAINGCENCIRSHEQTLRDAGVSHEKIHDLIRIAAVVKGFKSLTV